MEKGQRGVLELGHESRVPLALITQLVMTWDGLLCLNHPALTQERIAC